MTIPPFTITEQREAVEGYLDYIATGDGAPGPEMYAALQQAALTLGWLERKHELVREIARLDREAPHLSALLREFPGTRIDGVR